MARDVNANTIDFGSDASVDNFTQKSVCAWLGNIQTAGLGGRSVILSKSDLVAVTPTGWFLEHTTSATSDGHLRLNQDFTITDGTWGTPDDGIPNDGTSLAHVAVTYDRSATANDPNMYDDAVLQAELETSVPAGASNADAGESLQSSPAGFPCKSLIGFIVYDDTLFTAADINRHKYWGCAPGGPSTVSVWMPLWTDDLNNKGTATANATTAAPMASLPRVERMRRRSGRRGR